MRRVGRDGRHPRRAADQQHPVDLVDAAAGRLREAGAGEVEGAAQERGRHLLQLGAGEPHGRAGAVVGDDHVGALGVGELVLGPLGGEHERLGARGVVEGVLGVGVLGAELAGEVQRDPLVPVGAAELVVALHGEHRDAPVGQLDHGGVERAAAEVVDKHGLVCPALGPPFAMSGEPSRRPNPYASAAAIGSDSTSTTSSPA